jgi:hypothetical protein
MKTAIIVHGWDGSPKEPLFLWLKKELEKRKFKVITPKMPNSGKPKIKPWVNKLKGVVEPNDEIYFIAHSIGCQAVLRYIQSIRNNKKFNLILIAPWMHLDKTTIEEEGEEIKKIAKPWMNTPINYKKILKHLNKKTICIFSNDDPYVPLSEIILFRKKLGAKTILLKNKGHFSPADNIKKLREILKYI